MEYKEKKTGRHKEEDDIMISRQIREITLRAFGKAERPQRKLRKKWSQVLQGVRKEQEKAHPQMQEPLEVHRRSRQSREKERSVRESERSAHSRSAALERERIAAISASH